LNLDERIARAIEIMYRRSKVNIRVDGRVGKQLEGNLLATATKLPTCRSP